MDKILELKNKIHALKNGLKYINKTQSLNNEELNNMLKSVIKKENKQIDISLNKDSNKRKMTR